MSNKLCIKGKDNLSVIERLEIWNKLLNREEGVCHEEFEAEADRMGYNFESEKLHDSFRKDLDSKGPLKRILCGSNAKIVAVPKSRPKHYALSSKIDLMSLYNSSKSAGSRELLNILTSMRGMLPEDVLSDVSETYQEIMASKEEGDEIISFETDYTKVAEMKYFSLVYRSINKHPLTVTYSRTNSPDRQQIAILHPEYLKQYKSIWYVMGIIETTDKQPTLGRIPLTMISNIEPADAHPFIVSGTNYADYFDEIIGIENDPNCQVEKVQLLVSHDLYRLLSNNSLHHTQKDDKTIRKPGYKGISIEVKRNKELIRTLVGYGKDIIVVSPSKLRNQVKKEINAASNYYN